MTLDHLYLISQIVASIAVVITLIFVGFQLKESNREARLASIQTSIELEIEISSKFADHAETWDKIVRGLEIKEETELRRAIVLFNMLLSESENRFYQFNHGRLSTQSWQGRLQSLKLLVKLPVYSVWRDSIGGKNHTEDFLQLLETLSNNPE